MGVPLVFGDRLIGMLSLNKEEKGFYGEVHAERAAAFAAQAAVAIENARLFSALRDELSERARAQKELAQSEQRFRQLAENIDALFFVRTVDPPRLLYVSPAFERIWGRPATLCWEGYIETIHPDDREALMASAARHEAGHDFEYRILRPDGSLRWIRSRAFPIPDEAGNVLRVAGIAEDVTERKSVELMREDLVRTLVHDLKNPLTSMLASMDLLEASLAGPESSAKVAMVRIARRGGVKLRNLVDAILDVSRLEQGAMPLALEPVGLSEAVEEAFELQRALAEPRKLRLVNEVAAGFPRARADRELLSRILQNLVGNSIKFAPVGGQVRVGAVRDGGGILRMTVADDGPGLPDDLRERVFERFVTGQHAASGSGLGLPFCRLAVEAQGGRIRVESTQGGGALFAFTLPEAGESTV
jgi:PAS domain S-box-containing protein